MLLFAIPLIALVAHVVVASPIELDDGHHCRPNISVVNGFDSEAFKGTWYVESSTNWGWRARTCNQIVFHYKAADTYYMSIKIIRDSGVGCYIGCSTVKKDRAELHAWLQYKGDICDAPASDDDNAEQLTSVGCHGRHYPVHSHYFVLRAKYDDYALVFNCVKTYGHGVSASLMSRAKEGVSDKIRDKMNALLHENGWKHKLEKDMNTECDEE